MAGHSERKHALLSASGSARWLNCTPSAKLEEKYEQSGTSEYAEEGTLAHEFGELGLLLTSGAITALEYNQKANVLRESKYYSLEMAEEVVKYVEYVTEAFRVSKKKNKIADLFIEERYDLTAYIEDGFGTGDAAIIGGDTLEIIDLKYGKGIQVSAEDNSQLKLYSLGALDTYSILYDIKKVILTIVQPRLNHISSWEISADDLYKWGEEVVKVKAAQAYAGEGELCAGSWCKWCKAKAKCRALAEENLKLAKFEFADPKELSDEELEEIYAQTDAFIDWANAVSKYMLDEALRGKNWNSYKLVEGRSNRKWSDEELVKAELEANNFKYHEFMVSKLAGLGAIEKLVGKNNFNDLLGKLIIKPKGAPTLAPIVDKRPPYILDAKTEFDI